MQARRKLAQPHATERLPTLGSRAPAEPSERLDRSRLPKVAFFFCPLSSLILFVMEGLKKIDSEHKCLVRLFRCQEIQVPKWLTRSIILLPLAWNGATPRMPQLGSRHRRGPQGGESMCFSFAGLYVPVLELTKGSASPQVTETEKQERGALVAPAGRAGRRGLTCRPCSG